ncbi:sigma factor-like helix-turn-helix DNA-binding protein [Kitasatospora sp. NPDC058046]|uniref:sigma factor-like helix-turn-helix DNA-binding protein n=1 Tax=Kitasatospora sp. NPDC058046 TaxID=3346312 RepID=UPI0036DF7BDA
MTTPPTADSPTPERHRKPDQAGTDAGRLLRKLTPREAQTLAHLAAGHDLPRTAAALGVTPNTARSYLQRALRKLGTRTEAEAFALLAGALPHPPDPGPTGRPANPAGLDPAAAGPGAGVGTGTGAGGDATGKRRRTRSGKPAPAPSGGTPRAAADERARTARPTRGVDGGASPGAPAEDPRQASTRGATPGRAQGACTPALPAGGAATDHGPTAAADPGPPGGGSESAPPADPGRHADAPGTGQGRTENSPSAGPGHAPTAATDADGRGGAPYRAPAAQDADGAQPAPAPVERASADPGQASKEHATPTGRGPVSPGRAALAAAAPSSAEDDLDAEAPAVTFEELYETVHTRLVQQVFLLTACRHRAVHCVRRAFGEARRSWGAVTASGNPEGWVRVRACELALSPWHRGGPRRSHAWGLPHRRIRVRPADESQAVLPDHDRLTDRDRALLKALKRLSRPQRRALVLHDGLGFPAAAVAVEVESTQAAAEGRVWAARAALAQWVPELVGPDPAEPGFADGLSGLLHRAAVRGCPEPHRAPVAVLRARHRLWTASRTGAAALLTLAVGGAVLATLAGVRPAGLFRPSAPPTPAACLPAAPPAPGSEAADSADAANAAGPDVPLLPGGAPNGITSIWCSPAPGLEAVLVDPRPQAAARWELPAAARGAAPPPQGPVACPLWSPLPCTTGPRER